MKNEHVAALSVLLFMLSTAEAAEPPATDGHAASTAVPVEVFQAARPLTAPSGWDYPQAESHHGREGWVLLNAMINPSGRPHDVTVLESSGNSVLEAAAVKAVDDMTFQPARSGNTPVDSSVSFTLKFYLMNNANSARPEFISAYRGLMKALDTADRGQIDAQLAKLHAINLYEDAFRNYALYVYDLKWGTEAQQLKDLRRAMAGDSTGTYLPKELFTRVVLDRFALEVNSSDYGSALATWKKLKPIAPAPVRGQLEQTVNRILSLRDRSEPVATPASIDFRTSWNSQLLRNSFAISVKSGAVSEIKLRCQKKYLFFKYQADVQYTVSPGAGECGIEVIGDPGTKFELIQ